MARPAKAIAVASGARTQEDIRMREYLENTVKSDGEPVAPGHLTPEQRAVFNEILDGMRDAEILGKLDVYTLEATAVAIVAVREINKMIEDNPQNLLETKLISARAKYQTEFWRGCSELCLSPQSRAKLGAVAAQAVKGKEDPLVKALSMDD